MQPVEEKAQNDMYKNETGPQIPAFGASRWSPATRMAFRLIFAYEIIYSFPFPLSMIPAISGMFGWYEALLGRITIWTGAHLLHLSRPLIDSPLAGGDSIFGWTRNLTQILIAVAAAALWTVLDRRRPHYRTLQEWLWLYVRVVLGSALIGYGALKVIKVQFPDMFLWRLLSSYGDSTPAGLLWSFMGYSRAYNLFSGLVELVGGALLFVPRLATLGTLLCIGAMTNVVALNLGYDVNVKLYALNLLLMGFYLLAPESRRLLNVLVLNRTAEPVIHPALFQRKWLNAAMLAMQLVLLFAVSSFELYQGYYRYTHAGDGAPPPPLYGAYNVEEFIVNGQVRPAVFTDDVRWHRVTFERYNIFSIIPADGPVRRYRLHLDQARGSLTLTDTVPGDWQARFNFEQSSPEQLTLRGEMDGQMIQVALRRMELKSMPLYESGFHWISEPRSTR
jgi:hypothetical protein